MKEIKKSFGFDLGTSKLRMYEEGRLLTEVPTELEYEGKVLDNLLKGGNIGDFNATEQLLRQQIGKFQKPLLGFLCRPLTVLVSVPCGTHEVAVRSLRDSFEHAGSKMCYMLYDSYIAAIGLGIDMENSTYTIVDCGGGKTSICTLRGYKFLRVDSMEVGGRLMDYDIQSYFVSKYGLVLDRKEAERLKIECADFRKNGAYERMVGVTGKDKKTDSERNISINSREITDCITQSVEIVIERIVRHLAWLDDGTVEQVRSNGIHLIGGSFKMRGFIDRVAEKVNVSRESYSENTEYIGIGLTKIQANPTEVYKYMFY
ncbi:hypothetical protein EYV94_14605 [Puteibacter caeruleilacunae]|nr:hypothetical protein EYV94_14605 [Puteibacter caeruleilacunae]